MRRRPPTTALRHVFTGVNEKWDVVIVGAGPAGSAAALGALAARPRLRVLLLDRSDFPRDKACGDGIAPHVLDVLADVGVTGLLADWAPVRTLQLEQGFEVVVRDMARPGFVVPRRVFDSRLVDAALEAGAALRRQRVRSVTVHRDGVVIDGGIRARILVGADGAHSLVRSVVGLPPGHRVALALRGYAPTPVLRARRQVIVFGQTRWPSYAWSFDRGDGLSNVGYGELLGSTWQTPNRQGMLANLANLLPGSTEGAQDWLGHHLPLSSWTFRQPDGRVLLVGDAASLVNPMTGEGIYYAVATGVLAGAAAAGAFDVGDDGAAGGAYRRAVRLLLGTHLRHTSGGSRLLAKPSVVAAALVAAERDQGVFDDLVEIGLGRGLVTARLARRLVQGFPSSRPASRLA